MKVAEVMTPLEAGVQTSEPIRQVAMTMERNHCGFMPVIEGHNVVGVVTGSDIALRSTSCGLSHDTSIVAVMTAPAVVVSDEADVEVAATLMRQRRVHRLPVINHDGDVAGMVSMADIAEHAVEQSICQTWRHLADLPQEEIYGIYLG